MADHEQLDQLEHRVRGRSNEEFKFPIERDPIRPSLWD